MHSIQIILTKILFLANLISNIFDVVIAIDLRIGVVDWSTIDGEGTIWDGKFTQGVSSQFILAANHFNERRDDLIPDLSSLKSCNKNITIVQFCETAGNMRRASADTLYLLEDFNLHAIGKLCPF